MSTEDQKKSFHAVVAIPERVGNPIIVQIVQEYHIAKARQAAKALAESVGLGQVAVHYVATSASELANNLFFHAWGERTMTLVGVRRNDRVGIEITTEDDGPGIEDVEAAMLDGFTTNGGLGGGLPGVERLMDEFEIDSALGVGTRVVARKWSP